MDLPENLIAKKELRNRSMVFRDRFAGGDVLADMLGSDYAGLQEGLILAIPAGGVPVGLRLQQGLGLPLDLIVIRKIQIPGNTEAGFGALSQTGETLLNQELINRLGLSRDEIVTQTEKTRQELERKDKLFRQGRPFPELKGKKVILTDDGLASGFSMLAAVRMVKGQSPQEVVVAVPTAPLGSVLRLSPEVDRIYSAHIQVSGSFAVANAYQLWNDLSEAEVQAMLQDQPGPGKLA
ncbi:MAG: phosphoribosyltransferase [Desulfohalobiaceae bacterium]